MRWINTAVPMTPNPRQKTRKTSKDLEPELRMGSLDTPQKAIMRNEIDGQVESIDLLRRQLREVQDEAVLELQNQHQNFGVFARQYEFEAREVTRVEVGQAQAHMGRNFQNLSNQLT